MHEHQRLLREILILGIGYLVAAALIGFHLLVTADTAADTAAHTAANTAANAAGGAFWLGLVLLAILGFLAARWVFTATEALTSSAVAEFPPFWLLIYILVTAAMIALLPVAIIFLAVRYVIAKRRFNQRTSASSAF